VNATGGLRYHPDLGMSLSLAEPTTLATDYLLGAVGAVLGLRLLGQARRVGERSRALWALAFLAGAVAAFVGGTYHGLVGTLPPPVARALWGLTLLAVGAGSFLILTGTLYATLSGALRRVLLALSAAKLAGFCWVVALRPEFRWAVYDYAAAMALVLGLELGTGGPRRRRLLILAGVLVCFGAAALQQARIGLGPGFNHNDLFHVIQAAALYVLYRGAELLTDRR
jgi:Family of unknown function (DUF6962)